MGDVTTQYTYHTRTAALTPRAYATVALRKLWRKSQMGTHMMNYTVHANARESKVTSKFQHPGARSGAARPPRRLCYRPAVFFRHLRLTALSFSLAKIWRAFKKL